MSHIGMKLREFRAQKGWTQEEVAEKLDMSVSNYSNIEQGKTKVNTEKLKSIAEKLDTNVFEILALGEKNTVYIQENSGGYNGWSYVFHDSLPANYQALKAENEKLMLRNEHYQEKITLLEDKIKNLEKLVAALENKKG